MADGAPVWYAIIDGAQDPRLMELVAQCRDHLCLFKGRIDPKILGVSPWLVRIDEREQLLPTRHSAGGS
jgi:Domain of unknown function (DUF4123)